LNTTSQSEKALPAQLPPCVRQKNGLLTHMLPILFFIATLVCAFMGHRRYKSNDRGFAYAWAGCAVINAFCLVQALFFNA